MNTLFAITLVVQSCSSVPINSERMLVDVNGSICTNPSCAAPANPYSPGSSAKPKLDSHGRLCSL